MPQANIICPTSSSSRRGDGRGSVVIETDADEVAGINSRAELAAVEAGWQAQRRAQAMAEGATLIAPETVWFAHDTQVGRDVVIEPNVFFGPGVTIADGATIHAFSHIEGATHRRKVPRSGPMPGCAPARCSARNRRSAISSR